MAIVVKTVDLVKEYRAGFWRRRVRVLHGLTLEVFRGEIFGFLGPNGAGKTTTLKLLNGLIVPTSGRIWILDRELPDVGVRARIGFLPENPYFYEYLTGWEFLEFHGQLGGWSGPALRKRAGMLLEQVGLAAVRDVPLRKYSKGMLQRIGLAQALINDPELIFLDEPQSGLDPIGRKEIRDLILSLRDRGKTVFFSSHIIPDVEMICDRVGIIVGGRLVRTGRLEELLAAPTECIEVTASGLVGETLRRVAALAMRPPVQSGDRILISVGSEEALADLLGALVAAKARVHAVVPQRRSLEEEFLREIRQDGGSR